MDALSSEARFCFDILDKKKANQSIDSISNYIQKLERELISDIKSINSGENNQDLTISEITKFCFTIASEFVDKTLIDFKYSIISESVSAEDCQTMLKNGQAIIGIMYNLGNIVDSTLNNHSLAVEAWKYGIEIHTRLSNRFFEQYTPSSQSILNNYISKVKSYDSTYIQPQHLHDSGLATVQLSQPSFGDKHPGCAGTIIIIIILYATYILIDLLINL